MLPVPVILGILKVIGLIAVMAGITVIAVHHDKILIKVKKSHKGSISFTIGAERKKTA